MEGWNEEIEIMMARLFFLLMLTVLCCCKSSPPNPVDPKPATKSHVNPPRQSAAQVLASTAPEPIRSYSIKQHPYYAPYIVQALSNLVVQHGKSKRNHFHISRVKEYVSGYSGPWIYWKEGQILMTWDQNTGANEKGEYAPEFDLVSWWPRHVYRLNKDLVNGPYANGNDRLTRQEAGEIIRDCKREGDLFLIRRP